MSAISECGFFFVEYPVFRMNAGFAAQDGLHERKTGDRPFYGGVRRPFGWFGMSGKRDVRPEALTSVGQPLFCQICTDIMVQVMQCVGNG